VPLSPQALRILKDLRNITEKSKPKSKWVFPSTRKTGPHINHAQKAIERIVRTQAWSSGGTTCGAPRPA
jgi:integrase